MGQEISLDRSSIRAIERLAKAIEHSNQIKIDIERNRQGEKKPEPIVMPGSLPSYPPGS